MQALTFQVLERENTCFTSRYLQTVQCQLLVSYYFVLIHVVSVVSPARFDWVRERTVS